MTGLIINRLWYDMTSSDDVTSPCARTHPSVSSAWSRQTPPPPRTVCFFQKPLNACEMSPFAAAGGVGGCRLCRRWRLLATTAINRTMRMTTTALPIAAPTMRRRRLRSATPCLATTGVVRSAAETHTTLNNVKRHRLKTELFRMIANHIIIQYIRVDKESPIRPLSLASR